MSRTSKTFHHNIFKPARVLESMAHEVVVCLGCCCPQKGGIEVCQAFADALAERTDIVLQESGCMGPCSRGPIVMIDGVMYAGVQKKHVAELLGKISLPLVAEKA